MLVHIDALRAAQAPSHVPKAVTFTKNELNAILSIYSFQVSRGKWRDYAMDFLKHMAVFSIFRSSSEQPLVYITKTPGNSSSGYIYELFFEKKRLSRSGDLLKTLDALRDTLKEK